MPSVPGKNPHMSLLALWRDTAARRLQCINKIRGLHNLTAAARKQAVDYVVSASGTGRARLCAYCGVIVEPVHGGDLHFRYPLTCTYDYPPCTTCGQTPECAADCGAVLAALNAPGVRVIT